MLFIDNISTDPYFNLAAEEYLFKNFTDDIFMLWQNEASVIVGKHQNVWAEVNMDVVTEKNIPVARRFSGGGAVYHDLGNLNLTFIENNDNVDFNTFAGQIVSFLAVLGIPAQYNERRALLIDGLKISGSAQSVHKNRALYHATLLFDSDLETLAEVLESPAGQRSLSSPSQKAVYVQSVKSPVTNIRNYTGKNFGMTDFKNAARDFFTKNRNDSRPYTFSPDDVIRILELRLEKYACKDFIYNS
ncbi:MAG: lipoate--protein ligase family protein [Prevotellaceae bacterium]|jgi:lipoate-protein ligase A|nr:lipoate--protein ligase family protein [Prevotellaceae bacterium]